MMSDIEIEVWIIHPRRQILVTDILGPPAEICEFVSPAAQAAAKARGYSTVSEIGFPGECYLGHYSMPDMGWGEAQQVAQRKARALGYTVVYQSYWRADEALDQEDGGASPSF